MCASCVLGKNYLEGTIQSPVVVGWMKIATDDILANDLQ
jgi:hypothetical protein